MCRPVLCATVQTFQKNCRHAHIIGKMRVFSTRLCSFSLAEVRRRTLSWPVLAALDGGTVEKAGLSPATQHLLVSAPSRPRSQRGIAPAVRLPEQRETSGTTPSDFQWSVAFSHLSGFLAQTQPKPAPPFGERIYALISVTATPEAV